MNEIRMDARGHPHRRSRFLDRMRLAASILFVGSPAARMLGKAQHTAAVFDGPACAYADAIAPAAAGDGPLRTISVEERVGVARHGELVRVPLFFAANECPILEDLVIVPAGGGAPVPWQADEIRRGPDGGISRVHLWFAVDLGANEKRRFELFRRPGAPAAAPAPIAFETAADEIRFEVEGGATAWTTGGALRVLSLGGATCEFDRRGALPRAVLSFPAHEGAPSALVTLDENTADRTVEWDTGPLFAKVRVRLAAPEGVALVEEVRVPRDGREIAVSAALFPGSRYGGSAKVFQLLEGAPAPAARGRQKILHVPAGIRRSLRAEHAYTISALTAPGSAAALLSIPLVMGGRNGAWRSDEPDRLDLCGLRGLHRGGEGEKQTLYAFWTATRLVPAKSAGPDDLWQVYHDHVQPLVAVVDEPGVKVADLHAALRAIAGKMKAIGWRQEAGRALVLDKPEQAKKIMERAGRSKEANEDYLLRGARAARARITHDGQRPLRDDEKGRAYGQLDPYHITYTQSVAAALAVLENAPEGVTAVNLAMARGVRAAGGSVDGAGNPYIDCFSRTLNMQMGPVLFGLTAGQTAGDAALVRFYRDLATAPPVLGIFGRGQRPYTGAPAKSADQTDFLYQSICDFWLRTAELLANENLQLHPLAYGRYTDCIDVMADVYHGVGPRDKNDADGLARANFFRGQAHTHRWLGWSAAPFIRLLEDPGEHASVGLTEAVRYARAMKNRWKNWPDLTFYILADLLVRDGLARYERPELPPAPRNVVVKRAGNVADISWDAAAGAKEYRVFRGRSDGGPYTWLNSPYRENPPPALTATDFRDEEAKEDSAYVVLAVDAAGRASAWP